LFRFLVFTEPQNYFQNERTKEPKKFTNFYQYYFEEIINKMIEFYTMSVGNVQKWSVKVSNHLDNYLRSYNSLKSSKILPITHRYAR